MGCNNCFGKAFLICAVCVMCLSACSTTQKLPQETALTLQTFASDASSAVPGASSIKSDVNSDDSGAMQQTLYHTGKGWVVVKLGADKAQESPAASDAAGAEEQKLIGVGTSLDEIMTLDPDANYDFLYASWTEYPKISYHHTADGRIVAFYYDDAYCLERVEVS